MSHIKDRTLPSGMCQVNPYRLNETRPSPAPPAPAPAALRPTVKFLLISNYVEESDNNWRGARVTGRGEQGYSRDHQTPELQGGVRYLEKGVQ